MLFDYKNKIWLDDDGLFLVNGCQHCGRDQRSHGWYTACKSSYYTEPANGTRLARMKANRTRRQHSDTRSQI